MIHLPELHDVTARYAALDMEPLTVTAELVPGSRVVCYDPVYLAGLLARVVVMAATDGRGVPDTPDAYWLPLPLRLLWADNDGRPLWAASVFLGDGERDTVYSHKRLPDIHYTPHPNLKANVGRWMERRIPVPVTVCDRWQARCIGHGAEIERLLGRVAFLGKRRSIGLGEVRDWRVEPATWSATDVLSADGVLLHALPVECGLLRGADAPTLVGWTPPYWKPSLFAPGWPVGSASAEPDFYSAW